MLILLTLFLATGTAVYAQETDSLKGDSTGLLYPGEDPFDKIRNNIFLKLELSKRSVIIGEPVVASFLLFTRLHSRTEIIKNPGFYGFAVHDIVSMGGGLRYTDSINGRLFDVHVIRKLQLYPTRPGVFTIDPMEVRNKVIFSRVYYEEAVDNPETLESVEVIGESSEFELTLSTAPLNIRVNALPSNGKPETFTGAVGSFTATIAEELVTAMEGSEDFLEITYRGEGNFHDISAPNIRWPAGITALGIESSETVDASRVPIRGEKKFKYLFTADSAGSFVIPSIQFSYYDPLARRYRQANSGDIKLEIRPSSGFSEPPVKPLPTASKNNYTILLVVGLILIAVGGWFIYKKYGVKKRNGESKKEPVVEERRPSIKELVSNQDTALVAEIVFSEIWKRLQLRYGMKGSMLTRNELQKRLRESGVAQGTIDKLNGLLKTCEARIYAGGEVKENDTLAEDADEILRELGVGSYELRVGGVSLNS